MKNFSRGVTLVEIMIVISIITVITGIVVADFPKIKLNLSLSRATHLIAQDLKIAQSLSGSGRKEILSNGDTVYPRGYGVYIDTSALATKNYIIYADINGDSQYTANEDYVVKRVNFENQEPGIIIREILYANNRLSINFSPPNFNTNISNLLSGHDGVEIIVGSEFDLSIKDRVIYVNKAGLIEIK